MGDKLQPLLVKKKGNLHICGIMHTEVFETDDADSTIFATQPSDA
jgi:hypothetical protein